MKVYLVETKSCGFYDSFSLAELHSNKDTAISRARELIGHRDLASSPHALPIEKASVTEMEIGGGGKRTNVFYVTEDEEELA
ncbi:hypothetical protein CH302_19180 [Rhodococcus sp. 15-2388-1-1a]|uniref:hypothetical protein n=1 Tax=Nocardiaceae TaxID=85025 RepID=UPI000567728F|nr:MULTISPECIES: hypothetical protein [Rhodococcus]OZE95065.1 hypothetical protein CH302_19180 [Rhodococcus sp. 15-2388-1-1a]